MTLKAATKDELFDSIINIHQIVSDCNTGSRTAMIDCLDSVTEEILQAIPDADEHLSLESDNESLENEEEDEGE